jgi:hypothetical protein
VPYFDSPGLDLLEGTLDVDLSFLANASYSIFVVERRTKDRAGSDSDWILGTLLPPMFNSNACSPTDGGPSPQGRALQFGYTYYTHSNNPWHFTLDPTCAVASIPVPDANQLRAATIGVAVFDQKTALEQLWADGTETSAATGHVLTYAEGGAVGRAIYPNGFPSGGETRYQGNIAEIVVFDTAVADADRIAVQAYLAEAWGGSVGP